LCSNTYAIIKDQDSVIEQLQADRDALKERIDGWIRLECSIKESGLIQCEENPEVLKKYNNSTLILDKDAKL